MIILNKVQFFNIAGRGRVAGAGRTCTNSDVGVGRSWAAGLDGEPNVVVTFEHALTGRWLARWPLVFADRTEVP